MTGIIGTLIHLRLIYKEAFVMRKAHPHGVQGRRPIAPKYKRALKEKKIEAIRKWAKEKPAEEK